MNVVDILIGGILAFIMLSVGMSLRWKDFVYTFSRPKAFLGGICLQLLVLPSLAFAIASLAALPLPYKLGIVVLSTCPGGTTSNFITYLLNANAALSICLTVTNSFIALFSIPLIVNLGLQHFYGTSTDMSLPFLETIQQIVTIIILPVFIGVGIRKYYTVLADQIKMPLKWITLILLAILFLVKFLATEEAGGTGITMDEIRQILPYSILGNFLNLFAGFSVAYFVLKLKKEDQITLGVEVGIQNTSLAFLIGGTLLANEEILKPALVYAMFTFFTAILYGLLIKPEEGKKIITQLKKNKQ
ncbi:MAG: bile acid:sodium symporter [Saprospiraceae bacterium]